MMSVSGVRGIIGETMTPVLAAELGLTFGTHLGGGEVVIGRDSRPSGDMVRAGMVSGLLAAGCQVVDIGVAATPTVAVMVTHRRAAGGVVLTASHNPIVWNGVKFLTAKGHAPSADVANEILGRYREKKFKLVDVNRIGKCIESNEANAVHVARVLTTVIPAEIAAPRFKVVLDSVNGAGGAAGRELLEQLGCQVIHMNAEPTGHFAHTPEPTKENLTTLCDEVRKHGADVGFAQDPDADRLAIVDNKGNYIGEEYTLALAAKRVLARLPGATAANLSTSRMIDDLAKAAGAPAVIRTPVGEAHVAHAIMSKECVIGGEGNGGVIDPRVVLVRDSLGSMALVLDLMAAEKRPLDRIVAEMPRYAMVKKKYELSREKIDAWMKKVPGAAGGGRINDIDGIRIDWPEGWVHVRASNTEPIARAIAEAADEKTANELIGRVIAVQ